MSKTPKISKIGDQRWFTIPLAWIAVGTMLILGQIAAFNGVFDSPRYEMSEGSR